MRSPLPVVVPCAAYFGIVYIGLSAARTDTVAFAVTCEG